MGLQRRSFLILPKRWGKCLLRKKAIDLSDSIRYFYKKKPNRLHVSCVRVWFNSRELIGSYSSCMEVGLKAGNMNLRGAYLSHYISTVVIREPRPVL